MVRRDGHHQPPEEVQMDVMTGRTTTTEMVGSSGLNPNAPSFVPLAYRTVEEFSDQWLQLLDSSPWLRDYWLDRSHQRRQLENENKKKTLIMTMMVKKENDHHQEEEDSYDDGVRLPDADVLFHGYQPQEETEYLYTRDVEAWKAAKWNPAPEIPIRQRYLWGL